MDSKSKRSSNFSVDETQLLMQLAVSHKNVIECKKTDRITFIEKNDAWKLIEKQFNSESGKIYRNHIVLKKKYENLKKNSKKKYAEEKKELYKTGGGPAKPSTLDYIDRQFSEMLGDQIQGLDSFYDSDLIQNCEIEYAISSTSETENYHHTEYIEIDEDEDIEMNKNIQVYNIPDRKKEKICENETENLFTKISSPIDRKVKKTLQSKKEIDEDIGTENITPNYNITGDTWRKYKPEKLSKKVSSQIRTKTLPASKTKLSSNKWEIVAENKIKLIQDKIKNVNEKHAIEIKQLQEEHKFKKEEHELKMSILKAEYEYKMKSFCQQI